MDDLPRHRSGWQLLERIQWLVHVETDGLVPIIGGDGQIFITHFKEWCDANLPGLEGGRLNEFIGKGWFKSNGLKQYVLCSRWRRLEAPPDDLEACLALFLRHSSALGEASLPDYGAHSNRAPADGSSSRLNGSPEVCLGSFLGSILRRMRCV